MPGQLTGGLHEQNANTIIAQWLNAADLKSPGCLRGYEFAPAPST